MKDLLSNRWVRSLAALAAAVSVVWALSVPDSLSLLAAIWMSMALVVGFYWVSEGPAIKFGPAVSRRNASPSSEETRNHD